MAGLLFELKLYNEVDIICGIADCLLLLNGEIVDLPLIALSWDLASWVAYLFNLI